VSTQLQLTKYIHINISLSIYWIADEQHGQAKNLPTNKAGLLNRNVKKVRSVFPGMYEIWWKRQMKLTDDKSTRRLMQ
jgi:hypothetical protein